MGRASSLFFENGRWPSLNEVASRSLARITLPPALADDLLRRLYALGVTRHALMPTLDSAASAVLDVMRLFPGRSVEMGS